MPGIIQLDPRPRGRIINPHRTNYNSLTQPRIGVMLHFDGSSTDISSIGWFRHATCGVSYHWLVLDDGTYYEIAPYEKRAWHAGKCSPSAAIETHGGYKDANSAFIGIAVACAGSEAATPAQLLTVAFLTRVVFHREQWDTSETWRITGHEDEAFPRGRRSDPTGPDKLKPSLSTAGVRQLVQSITLT